MTCKYGKLKHPRGRRKCKLAPRGRKRVSARVRAARARRARGNPLGR